MKLMVLDGNSIANRAFYGVRLLHTKDGVFTNAIFGFLNILDKLKAEEKPDALCVTFDMKAPTFRHKEYDGYKAQRKKMPEELSMQMPILRDVLTAMHIPYYESEGYEADDIIGTISEVCNDKGWECLIVTGDKDSFQLITENAHVLHVKTVRGVTETIDYTVETFVNEYGFLPPKMVDLKALMGDVSDNIPGIAGVGPKTASDLIKKFGSLDGVYENIDSKDIKDNLRKKLTDGKEAAYMSYHLATILKTVPIEFSPEENLVDSPDNDTLYALFKSLEFSRLITKYGLTLPKHTEKIEVAAYEKAERADITTVSDAKKLVSLAEKKEIVFVSAKEELSVLGVMADGTVYIVSKEYEKAYDTVAGALFTDRIKKGGHEVKKIMRRLLKNSFSTDGWAFDSSIAAYLMEPTDGDFSLTSILPRWCGRDFRTGDEESEGQLTLLSETDDTEELINECEAVSSVYGTLMPKIIEKGMEELFREIEMPLCAVLADMENEGVLIDRNALSEYGDMLSLWLTGLEQEIYDMAGEKFNINSPKQLGTVLFENLMLPAPKKTKTGWSTNADVLEKLRNKHPIIGTITEYRQISKLKSTYADGLLKYIDSDGRIRTTFQMTVTATGRLSSTDPNLQNIPVRSEFGEEIRKMFTAKKGYTLVDADYSQIELRILAHISEDRNMRETFLSGGDIHAATAAQVFRVPQSEVTPKMRSSAKAVNFGIVYGISQFSLSQDIGVSVREAKEYIDRYLENFSGVREYMGTVVEKAKENGYVSTLYGRRRSMPELASSNRNVRAFGERVALNMPIQGTAADIMKKAMVKVHDRLKRELPQTKLLLQIHDELIVECPESDAERCMEIVTEEMQAVSNLSVPLTADAGCGKSWYEAK